MDYKKVIKNLRRKSWQAVTASALALILSISAPALALGSPLDDVRYLLENEYVDTVDSRVLNAPTVDEMLKGLGDPHTTFFTQKEYQDFINSMDLSFSGIGIYIQLVPRGLEVVSVIEGSPAQEVKLKPGDVIIEAAGQSLAGLSQEVATGLLRGPAGSSVNIVVLRGEERLNLRVERRAIEVPTVTGEMIGSDIGYVAIESFGETTVETFSKVVKELDKLGAKAWIMDLRNNPGGYLTTALDLAGYFIGNNTALQTKDRSQKFQPSAAFKHDFMIAKPVIFLTNENSASASEILTAAVKDYQKAAVVGKNTFGKGSVQSLYQLTDGDVLKLTVAKFYSPYGKEINGVGISPDVPISDNDPVKMAEMMLRSYSKDGQDSKERIQFTAGGKDWQIDLGQARTSEYWSTYREFVERIDPPGGLLWKNGSQWNSFDPKDKERVWPFFYPGYSGMTELKGIPLDKTFTVRFTAAVKFQSVSDKTIELVEVKSGKRIPVKFEQSEERAVKVIPQELLEPGKTYWLITHQGITGQDGSTLREGVITPVTTK